MKRLKQCDAEIYYADVREVKRRISDISGILIRIPVWIALSTMETFSLGCRISSRAKMDLILREIDKN